MKSSAGVILVLAFTFLSATYTTADESDQEYSDKLADIFAADNEGGSCEYGDQFEGDLILSKEQTEYMKYGAKNGITSEKYRWPNAWVPYKFHKDHFEKKKKDLIRQAMQQIQDVSCVRFHEARDFEDKYLNISTYGIVCYSPVGYTGRRQQFLYLTDDAVGTGCFRLGNILHAFLHTLGFYHQHTAPERDDYIKILWENIIEFKESYFARQNSSFVTNFGVPYDYGSIMHYSSTAFSKNGNATIKPKKKGVTIGQREAMSTRDIIKLNLMYRCPIPYQKIEEYSLAMCDKYKKTWDD